MRTPRTKIGNTQTVAIGDLSPASYNPRKWDKAAVSKLKESLTRFGLVDPIIANSAPKRKNIIIGGHFRWHVAKELGYTEVPVVYVNIPSLEKEKEFNLRLNRNTGEWDFELLKSFDINLLADVGFDDTDLSKIWDEQLEVEDDNFDTEKELAKIKKPTTKPGDVYQLGIHRLECGDSTDPVTIAKLLGKNKADMIYSDPPYNIALDYNNGIGTKGKYGGKLTNDQKTDREYREFLKKTLVNGLSVANPDCHIFYYCDEKYIGLLQTLYSELGLTNRRVCLWIKNN